MSRTENGTPQLVAGLFTGFFIAALVAGGLAGVIGYVLVKRTERNMRRGWNLVPVVVAATDIEAGTPLTFDMISQRSIPEQFLTASVVKPDSASYLVNQSAFVPLRAGQPLRWTYFQGTSVVPKAPYPVSDLVSACTKSWQAQPGVVVAPQTLESLRARIYGGAP